MQNFELFLVWGAVGSLIVSLTEGVLNWFKVCASNRIQTESLIGFDKRKYICICIKNHPSVYIYMNRKGKGYL